MVTANVSSTPGSVPTAPVSQLAWGDGERGMPLCEHSQEFPQYSHRLQKCSVSSWVSSPIWKIKQMVQEGQLCFVTGHVAPWPLTSAGKKQMKRWISAVKHLPAAVQGVFMMSAPCHATWEAACWQFSFQSYTSHDATHHFLLHCVWTGVNCALLPLCTYMYGHQFNLSHLSTSTLCYTVVHTETSAGICVSLYKAKQQERFDVHYLLKNKIWIK